jgi:hypothetical protein
MLDQLKERWQKRVKGLKSKVAYDQLPLEQQVAVDHFNFAAVERQRLIFQNANLLSKSPVGWLTKLFRFKDEITTEIDSAEKEVSLLNQVTLWVRKELVKTAVYAAIDIAIPFIPYGWIPGVNTVYRRVAYAIAGWIIERRFKKKK